MKKQSKLLLTLFASLGAISLISCEKNSSEEIVKTNLVFGQLYDESKNALNFAPNAIGGYKTSYSTLSTLMLNKESFVAVIIGDEYCSCWQSFRENILLPYIKENSLRVYLIPHQQLDKENRDTFGINFSSSHHNVVLVNKGEVSAQKFAVDGEEFNSTYSVFKNWMDERIGTKPKMLYVNKAQLDNLYKGIYNVNSSERLFGFSIYFSRFTCGDCSYMQKEVLSDLLLSIGSLEKSYIIDCDVAGIRYDSNGELDSAQWNTFKETYGLASSATNPAGFDSGYVPTFFHVQCTEEGQKTGDVIDGADVFLNDSYEKQADGSFKITSSYFSEDRMDHEELSYLSGEPKENKVLKDFTYSKNPKENATEIQDYYYYRDSVKSFHSNVLKKYLLHYLSLNV